MPPKYVNKIALVGRLGCDVEMRNVGTTEKASFRLATETSRKDKDTGEWVKNATWHNVVCWGKVANQVAMLGLTKGSWAQIDGKIETRSWDGPDGKKQYRTEVMAWEVTAPVDDSPRAPKPAVADVTGTSNEISDSDIPF